VCIYIYIYIYIYTYIPSAEPSSLAQYRPLPYPQKRPRNPPGGRRLPILACCRLMQHRNAIVSARRAATQDSQPILHPLQTPVPRRQRGLAPPCYNPRNADPGKFVTYNYYLATAFVCPTMTSSNGRRIRYFRGARLTSPPIRPRGRGSRLPRSDLLARNGQREDDVNHTWENTSGFVIAWNDRRK
jgi:hypothetical protein